MTSNDKVLVCRRALLLTTVAVALSSAASAAKPARTLITIYKDPNCGCCQAWAERMAGDSRFSTRIIPTNDMAAVKRRLGVPGNLVSCHTATVGGYVIEGHVPPADVARLLAARPAGVTGVAVPGMPAGSPGMEVAGGRRDSFDVIAFGSGVTRRVFARYE